MEDDQTQTVTDPGTPPVEATPSAEPDLDTLLNDWGKTETKPESKPETKPEDAPRADYAGLLKGLKPLVDFADSEMKSKAATAEKKVADEAVALIKSDDALKEVNDEFVHDHLIGKYNRDTEFRAAYDNLGDNPTGWTKALEDAKSGLVEKISALPGSTIRSDMEAAQAAVAGSSPEVAPEAETSAVDMASMSDQEFAKYKLGLEAKS